MMATQLRVARTTAGSVGFTNSEVNAVAQIIDGAGIVAMLEPRLPSGGRPRQLNLRALCIGLWLLTASGQPTYLNRVAALLNNLPASSRRSLNLGRSVTNRQVSVLFGHLAAAMDGSPHYAGRGLNEQQRQQRDDALQSFIDLLIAATLPTDDEYTAPGDLAFDATIIDCNSRPVATKRRKAIRAAVKQAAATGGSTKVEDLLLNDAALASALGVPSWGEDPQGHTIAAARAKSLTRPAADRDATTLVYKGRLRHSYAVHFGVDVPSRDNVAMRLARKADEVAAAAEGRAVKAPMAEPVPMVVRRLVVTASTASPAQTGTQLLTTLSASPPGARNQWAPRDLMADRGYSHAVPQKWHLPLRTAGFNLIHDLHPTRRGHTSSHDGAVIIDGQAYSPGILDYPDLVNAQVPSLGAPYSVWEDFHKIVELRRPFLLPIKEISASGVSIRVECPALRNKVGCPLRGNLSLVVSKGVPEVFTGPSAPLPTLCTQKSMRIPGDVLAQSQDLGIMFGSRDWYDAYIRRRPRVEGQNGILKNPTGPHIAAGRIRVRGRAKVSIFVALVACAVNVANVAVWRAQRAMLADINADAKKARRSRRPQTTIAAPTGRRGRRRSARAPAA